MAFARTLLTHRVCELLRLMNMWKVISNCHQSQMKAVEAMRRLDNSAASEPTTSSHRHSTAQLEAALMTSVNFLLSSPTFFLPVVFVSYCALLIVESTSCGCDIPSP
jgi:hypothetical protein